MPDLDLEWKDDIGLTPSGDLALVDGPDLTRQRIERRLFTAVRGYLWHQSYGTGLPERIGKVAKARNIEGLVRSQIGLEATVSTNPPAVVAVTEDASTPGLFAISIRYTDAVTGVAIAISLEVPGTR